MHVHRALLEKPFPFLQSSPRNIVPHLFLMMLTFQSGDICVEEKVSADTELHIKSCMITARGEIQTEKKSRLLQTELAFGSSQSSNKIATENTVMHICSYGQVSPQVQDLRHYYKMQFWLKAKIQ